jgi:hypothetical protein
MNDKDKEAFEKWFELLGETHLERVIKLNRGASHKAWQAACEYKDKEINNDEELLRNHMNSIGYRELKKLQAENKKLREALEKIIDQYFDLPYELRMKKGLKEGRDSLIAREALKEVGKE